MEIIAPAIYVGATVFVMVTFFSMFWDREEETLPLEFSKEYETEREYLRRLRAKQEHEKNSPR